MFPMYQSPQTAARGILSAMQIRVLTLRQQFGVGRRSPLQPPKSRELSSLLLLPSASERQPKRSPFTLLFQTPHTSHYGMITPAAAIRG
jgi:hypothetical protein